MFSTLISCFGEVVLLCFVCFFMAQLLLDGIPGSTRGKAALTDHLERTAPTGNQFIIAVPFFPGDPLYLPLTYLLSLVSSYM